MEITRIPAQRKSKRVRIAVYCRVSTKLEEQEDSLEMQREAYSSLISLRSDWELVGVYSDSLSGLSAEKRPDFMRMINDALTGKIDHILCKSVSRFSRNVAECKKYADMLRIRNVTVEFEKEHLRTDDPTSSFVFSLMSAIAENESRSISENVKWGYRERFKRGEYNLGNNRVLGYDCVDGKLVPNKLADGVRLIYRLYLEGNGLKEIAEKLNSLGLTGRSGNPLTDQGILYILSNEVYVGDKMLQKRAPKDFITKQPDKSARYESKYLVDDHEAVIDRLTWESVQNRLRQRREDIDRGVKYHGGRTHFLYGKTFCGGCGALMPRRTLTGYRGEKYKAWECREHHLGRAGNGCKGRNIRETELMAAICAETGCEEADVERFLPEIERIEVWMGSVTVKRPVAPAKPQSVQGKFTA